MELELERTEWNGYDTVLDTAVCREETLEAIVPDACPDILRICDVEGTACLAGKEAQEGRVELSGTVRTVLLYLPDGEAGMRRMEVTLPFTCTADAAAITPACQVIAVPRVQSADARLLNPRKVLVRVSLAADVQVFCPSARQVCSCVSRGEDSGVEQRSERCDTCATVCVQEKPFIFSDDLTLSGGKPEAEELLKTRAYLRCGETKVIGNKLIFKGETTLQLLCRASDGALFPAEFQLPFSQIMEISGAGEEAVCDVQMTLTDLDCTMDGGDGRTFSVALGLLAQAAVREERTIQLLADAYSTLYPMTCENSCYTLDQLLDRGEKEITIRELLELGDLLKEVSDAYACIGTVTQSREGERVTVTAQVNVTVLYRTADGETGSLTRPLQAICVLDLPEGARCSCRCVCTAPVFAAATAGGLEVRFPVCFQYAAHAPRSVAGISAASIDEGAPLDHAGRPSIVLRMVGEGERLWDIAKSYGTTSADILQANALEEDAPAAGQLLLIPRKR